MRKIFFALSGHAMAQSPIQKVVEMLGKMESEINKEIAEQGVISKKLQCWAGTNKKEKTAAIEAAEASIAETSALIEKLTGSTEQLKVTVAKITKDIAEDEKDLKKLEDERAKEAEAYRKYELETTESVQQLKAAIQVLKKHQGKEGLVQLRKALARASLTFPAMAVLEESKSAVSFLEYSPHASASGEIFGVLTQMMETMDADFASRQKQEADAVATFNRMRKAKRDEIASGRAELRKKKDKLADELEDLARAKKSVKETTDQLDVDRKFLADVEERSAADKGELAARIASQTEELRAIRETVTILTEEEARAHFQKTAPSFLQLLAKKSRSLSQAQKKAKVLQLLNAKANKSNNLSLVASTVKLAAFEKIKKFIANLIEDLKAKKAEEVEKRNYCIAEFDNNKVSQDETANLIEDLTAKKESLIQKSKKLAEQIDATKASQKKLQLSIASATTVRVESSTEYQTMFRNYLTTKDILGAAMLRLETFYGKGASFLAQEPKSNDDNFAPVGLKKEGYKKRNGGGVVDMIKMILEDSKRAAMLAQSDEAAAQLAYENAMADSRVESATLKATLGSLVEEKADTDSNAQQTSDDQKAAVKELEDLTNTKKALHGECDFLMANFDNRQAGFGQEAEALQQAIQILSGSGGI